MNKIVIALSVALISASAFAAKMDDAPTGAASCEGLKIGSGPDKKGYSNIVKDIVKACGSEVPVCEVNTEGGLDNLTSMSTKSVDIGIAQVDTWATMKGGDDNIAALQGVFALNYNYMHVLTSSSGFTIQGAKKYGGLVKGDSKQVVITRFSELRGQTVAVVGTAQLLARQLDRTLNYGMNFVDAQNDDQAFKMVRSGQVSAAITVSSWPSGSVKNLKQDSGLTMIPFDADISKSSSQYIVRAINYKGLGVYNSNALAIPNVMFTRPFKGEKSNQVAKLKSCIASKLEDLQEGDFQPAWNEIKNFENTYDIPKFGGVAGPAKGKKGSW